MRCSTGSDRGLTGIKAPQKQVDKYYILPDKYCHNMAANDVTGALPPFPENVLTHPLLVIDYGKLVNGDKDEEVTSRPIE